MVENVPGRSFADIGCMWAIHGRRAFLAEDLGAPRVTAYDGMSPTEEFVVEHRRRDSKVRFVQGDLHDPVSVEEIGVSDVVLCNGVIYHSPSPHQVVEHLHRITGELLVLGSHTVAELPGIEQACVFYPEISPAQQAAYAAAHPDAALLPGMAAPFDYTPGMGFANMWWGITPSALRAMLKVAGFEVLYPLRNGAEPFFTQYVARRLARESPVPRPEQTRESAAQARARGLIPDLDQG